MGKASDLRNGCRENTIIRLNFQRIINKCSNVLYEISKIRGNKTLLKYIDLEKTELFTHENNFPYILRILIFI